MTKVIATLTDKGLSLVIDGDPQTVSQCHTNYDKIVNALREGEHDIIPDLLDTTAYIRNISEGSITVEHGVVKYKDQALDNSVTRRLVQTLELGLDPKPLARFLNRLMRNPSHRSVQQLYSFMEACDLPITEDGRLLAYRSVGRDGWDTHTGKTTMSLPPVEAGEWREHQTDFTVNGVTTRFLTNGATQVSMARNMVDDNPDQTCSNGLHVCSQAYGMYGSKLLMVAVCPSDVVSVPNDYNMAKMRVCQYEVLKCVADKGFETFEDAPIYNDYPYSGDDYPEEDDDYCWGSHGDKEYQY